MNNDKDDVFGGLVLVCYIIAAVLVFVGLIGLGLLVMAGWG